jgi:hypothetical protein
VSVFDNSAKCRLAACSRDLLNPYEHRIFSYPTGQAWHVQLRERVQRSWEFEERTTW